MKRDAAFNPDGFALVCLDPGAPEMNIRVQSMDFGMIRAVVKAFLKEATQYARVFVHSRLATTGFVGIGFNHGFDDRSGRIIMHNGILRTGKHLAVDSFVLAELRTESVHDMFDELKDRHETYGNIFVIDPDLYSFYVIRLITGQLHTDGRGNYSTNAFASIRTPMKVDSYEIETMPCPPPAVVTPKDDIPDDWEQRQLDSNGYYRAHKPWRTA